MGTKKGQFLARLLCGVVVVGSAAVAEAALKHRYSFTTDASDSVGGAAFNGTVIDAAGGGAAVFAGGELDVSSNTGQGSNAIAGDVYVDLPNGMISSAINSGTAGALTLEFWATTTTHRTWQRLGDFGTSNDGEDTSNGAGNVDYLFISPSHGRFTDGIGSETHSLAGPLAEAGVTGPSPLNVQQHIVGVYNVNDTSAGARGTGRLYINGVQAGAWEFPNTFAFTSFPDVNNWLGRAQWGDPLFTGKYNEFRVYDNAQSQQDITLSAFYGPDSTVTAPPVNIEVNKTTGRITLKNTSALAAPIQFYKITSAGNALSTAGWSNLDDQNFDATDGLDGDTTAGNSPGEGWDEAGGSSAGQLIEYFLKAAGSTLTAGSSISLGNGYNPAIFGANNGDLTFEVGLASGATFTGLVTYVTGPAGVVGDYNNNGTVDAADYTLWRDVNGTGATLQNRDPANTGNISAADYTSWRTRFGNTSAVAAGAAVPEPTSVVVCLLGAGVLSLVRRRVGT